MTSDVAGTLWRRHCAETTARDRRNQRVYTVALALWAVAYLGATWVSTWDAAPTGMGWASSLAPPLLAVGVVWAFARYLAQADELVRAIELQAVGLAVAVGFVVWSFAEVAARLTDAVSFVDWPVLAMIVAYAVGTRLGWRRVS